ncbi:MAG TPA: peptide chain release factor N(5)-glutamine methyltransferase [Bacteroidales bacterium]|mgnify:CR=1 FL=1|jgi:release factor glutamine methyltransferase|nr:peptide chain release factor N(5)-glutamine methyltransferase [Bacteroidales bacterium]HOF16574.1 peptide chain release factor N(5)-glutamine methyltransferase [Bacteroidales bacterium]HON21094.1 peptide chain release factor N(5)-glutamine methyltransferase [Bacteroidales bacterium]HOR81882.1 peptide chain release factor N(5)-glutamine methyltransferase [Bacteroidales bacterium]HPJ91679.1 peptide chain release factor N(5)-glutamine methyltransferase [Bacteroidales bacterium]
MTIKEIWNQVFNTLKSIENEREAATVSYYLLKHYTGLDKINISLYPHKKIDSKTIAKIQNALEKLKQHQPIQYIIGKVDFGGISINVNRDVLIPRPETEELFYWLTTEHADFKGKIIDLCTGSGCIAIAFAKKHPQAEVLGIDHSLKALKVAKENARLNNVNVAFECHDILSREFREISFPTYDIIVGNPPYVRESEKKDMHPKVVNYEPSQALFVTDEQPLIFYHAIFLWANRHLSPKGKLFIEINENLAKETMQLLQAFNFTTIELRYDMQNKARMIKAEKILD